MKIDSIFALAALVATLLFAAALAYRFFTVWKAIVKCQNVNDLLSSIRRDKACAGLYFVLALILLTCFSGLKAFLIWKGLFDSTLVTVAAFGTAEGGSLAANLGPSGLVIGALGIFAGFRYLKAAHYLQLLFALRKELDIEGRF